MNGVQITIRSLKTSAKSNGWVHKWSRFKRWQEMHAAHAENVQEKQRNQNFIKLPTGLYITPERPDDCAFFRDFRRKFWIFSTKNSFFINFFLFFCSNPQKSACRHDKKGYWPITDGITHLAHSNAICGPFHR